MNRDDQKGYVACAKVKDIPQGAIIAVNVQGHSIALANNDGKISAVDNRCPHMGYPLNKGTIHNGILICHWHHARFDLISGCTFDPWADDVRAYPLLVKDGNVYVNVHENGQNGHDPVSHWKRRLLDGLKQNLNLIMAKAVIGLRANRIPAKDIVEIAGRYGLNGRRAGWGPGMTILTAMANIADKLSESDQILALYQGSLHVSRDTSGSPPRVLLSPLEIDKDEVSIAKLKEWFRYFIEVRNSDGAERALLTAISLGATPREVCDMMVSAATDHFYRSGGHVIDFINKGFEFLEHVGWEKAEEVLPTLVGMIAGSSRSEEENRWKSPIDLVSLLKSTFEELELLFEQGKEKSWDNLDNKKRKEKSERLVEVLLGDEPYETINSLKGAIKDGAKLTDLTQLLAYAAALRIAKFHTKNEFGDWIAVIHTYTYANALHQCVKRCPESTDLARGVFHGAMVVYFDRWFNMPSARLPQHRRETETLSEDANELLDSLEELFSMQSKVDEAGMRAYRYLSLGDAKGDKGNKAKLYQQLGHLLLREDSEFHSFQILEAAIRQSEELKEIDEEKSEMTLVAAARYLAAHSPTSRALGQTLNLALRLHRGENLSADDPDEKAE